ncbi:MAG TPA: glycerophosphodiester phosphodiesterase [Acidimicrobiales bacterium]|nr:glycerophosphodiester phosphodiesterase [Acidimicrobiales bacterium]
MTAVFAHRGWTEEAPENTVAAFVAARRLGADGVELDVRSGAGGALVVHHDAILADGRPVAAVGPPDLPPDVPLLAAALEACAPMAVNVEIKNVPGEPGFDPERGIAARVVRAVAATGWPERVVVSSFDPGVLDAVVAADPDLAVGWLLGRVADPPDVAAEARRRRYRALHPHVSGVDAALVAAAHGAGLGVAVWTVNEPGDLAAMAALGVDAVITDRLAAALAARPGPGGTGPAANGGPAGPS